MTFKKKTQIPQIKKEKISMICINLYIFMEFPILNKSLVSVIYFELFLIF